MPVRILAVVAMFLAVAYGSFRLMRRRLAERPGRRAGYLFGGAVLIAAAAAAVFWLPAVFPETPGSPAKLVWFLLCWSAGGAFALLGFPALLVALLPAPRPDS